MADTDAAGIGPDKLSISRIPAGDMVVRSSGEPPRRKVDIHDYLNAATDAANRSRNVTITMVVASTLVFVAIVNSLQSAWMLQRIHAANDKHSTYVASKIASPVSDFPSSVETDKDDYDTRYYALYNAMWKSYIDNAYYVRVPFFGFALDANDIGVFAGIAFLVILLMMRFCLGREIENVRASFQHLHDPADRYEFYILLSMRQMFTVPETEMVKRSWFSAVTPKAVWFAPLFIESLVAWHDLGTYYVGEQIDDLHTAIIVWSNVTLVGLVLLFTVSVIRRMRVMDRLWDSSWAELKAAGVTQSFSRPQADFFQDPIRWTVRRVTSRPGRPFQAAGEQISNTPSPATEQASPPPG